jgi:hypothetical protein
VMSLSDLCSLRSDLRGFLQHRLVSLDIYRPGEGIMLRGSDKGGNNVQTKEKEAEEELSE